MSSFHSKFYSGLATPQPDALHGVMAKYHADPRLNKIDLGVGVYRDGAGHSSVMGAIKQAERRLLEAETSKAYLGLIGVERFISAMTTLLFEDKTFDRYARIQSVGGSGGIRLAVEISALANSNLIVHIGLPTWPNHLSICETLGIKTETFTYFDKQTQTLCIDELFSAVEQANAGDIVILHGPCHNPTGADLGHEQFLALISLAAQRGVVPLVDAAYYGLGNNLGADLAVMRAALEICPNGFLVMSCSKAFGLYRERTGILFAATPNVEQKQLVQATLEMAARSNYSMPPAHGANAVAEVLSDAHLRDLWMSELNDMRSRISHVRQQLAIKADGSSVFSFVESQKGIFSLLPISASIVSDLADNFAIFMPNSGRINIAGIKDGDAERLVDAVHASIS